MNATVPDFMDVGARNSRVYQHLLGMGLYVEPVTGDDGKIAYLLVTAGQPERISGTASVEQPGEEVAVLGVGEPTQRPEVPDVIGAAKRLRDRVVVEFPTVP